MKNITAAFVVSVCDTYLHHIVGVGETFDKAVELAKNMVERQGGNSHMFGGPLNVNSIVGRLDLYKGDPNLKMPDIRIDSTLWYPAT